MINVAELKVGRRYGDWFLRNGTRMHDTLVNLKAKPLPSGSAPGAPVQSGPPQRSTAGAPRQGRGPENKPAGAWGARPVAAS
mgnify:CR=1 FL=1